MPQNSLRKLADAVEQHTDVKPQRRTGGTSAWIVLGFAFRASGAELDALVANARALVQPADALADADATTYQWISLTTTPFVWINKDKDPLCDKSISWVRDGFEDDRKLREQMEHELQIFVGEARNLRSCFDEDDVWELGEGMSTNWCPTIPNKLGFTGKQDEECLCDEDFSYLPQGWQVKARIRRPNPGARNRDLIFEFVFSATPEEHRLIQEWTNAHSSNADSMGRDIGKKTLEAFCGCIAD